MIITIIIITSWRARRCPWKKKFWKKIFDFFLAYITPRPPLSIYSIEHGLKFCPNMCRHFSPRFYPLYMFFFFLSRTFLGFRPINILGCLERKHIEVCCLRRFEKLVGKYSCSKIQPVFLVVFLLYIIRLFPHI